MTRKVLLVTTVDWTSTARYAGAFAAASWLVDTISPKGAPVTLSRYVDRCYRYRPLFALSSLRAAIEQARPDLLVTCDDRAVGLLLRLYGKEAKDSPVATLIRRSLGAPEEFDSILSRGASMKASRAPLMRQWKVTAVPGSPH